MVKEQPCTINNCYGCSDSRPFILRLERLRGGSAPWESEAWDLLVIFADVGCLVGCMYFLGESGTVRLRPRPVVARLR